MSLNECRRYALPGELLEPSNDDDEPTTLDGAITNKNCESEAPFPVICVPSALLRKVTDSCRPTLKAKTADAMRQLEEQNAHLRDADAETKSRREQLRQALQRKDFGWPKFRCHIPPTGFGYIYDGALKAAIKRDLHLTHLKLDDISLFRDFQGTEPMCADGIMVTRKVFYDISPDTLKNQRKSPNGKKQCRVLSLALASLVHNCTVLPKVIPPFAECCRGLIFRLMDVAVIACRSYQRTLVSMGIVKVPSNIDSGQFLFNLQAAPRRIGERADANLILDSGSLVRARAAYDDAPDRKWIAMEKELLVNKGSTWDFSSSSNDDESEATAEVKKKKKMRKTTEAQSRSSRASKRQVRDLCFQPSAHSLRFAENVLNFDELNDVAPNMTGTVELRQIPKKTTSALAEHQGTEKTQERGTIIVRHSPRGQRSANECARLLRAPSVVVASHKKKDGYGTYDEFESLEEDDLLGSTSDSA